ncbi:hypothetical protein Vadar_023445 [Vaccinium darrowii]|uniref:Uncharacterized protein n=1 Tax=Vaccinium darrowii TaxID=229202 RepID=A0ACB7Y8B2_9ERIC|nr:hypothetical protein Vadar_023445 [Vaccinium darrowii]
MSTPLEAYKKRKLNPKIYGLCTFELQPCFEPKSSDVEDGMPVNIIEESLKHFLAPFYNHCRCTGVEGGSKNLCGKEAVDLLERICKNLRARKFSNVGANLDSHWPVGRLKYVEDAVVDAMKEKKLINKGFNYGMLTRQEARDVACL